MRRSAFLIIQFVVAISLVSATSCSHEDTNKKPGPGDHPDVLIVTFDTTRPDHLGPYGYKFAFTPTLDRLAEKAIRFNRAFSSVPVTLPSHTTLMTGLYPFYHGVRDNSHFILNSKAHTLAEIMKENGYQTAAMVSSFVLNAHFGLNQGFDTYDDSIRNSREFPIFAVPERNAEAVTNAAIEWLKSNQAGDPYFLWVHYYDPHSDYNAPVSFTKYNGHPYDVEIAYADDQLGRLLNQVNQGYKEGRQTLIVFASDHGEALGQHGESTHAYFTYDSTLHVPLLIHLPDGSHGGEKIDTPVGLVDLMPTILDLAGLPVPGPDQIHGRSLVPLIDSPTAPESFLHRAMAFECYEPYYTYGWSPAKGIRVGETKYFDMPSPELYLLSENPGENLDSNLYDKRPKLAADMKDRFRNLLKSQLAFPPFNETPQAPPPDVIEKLRALGYAAAEIPANTPEDKGLDLKEALPVFEQVLDVMNAMASDQFSVAVHRLLNLSKKNPENPRLMWMLSFIAATHRDSFEEAIVPLEKALQQGRISPEMIPEILLNCGRAYLGKDKNDQALDYFEQARQLKPDYAAAYSWLGIVTLRLGRQSESIKYLRRANELFGDALVYPRVTLGLAYLLAGKQKDWEQQWAKLFKSGQSLDAVWPIIDGYPIDRSIAQKVAPLLKQCAADTSPEPRLRALAAILGANFFLSLKQNGQALDILTTIQSLMSDQDSHYLSLVATLHLQLGQSDEALQALEQAYKINSDQGEIVATLASVLETMGQIDQAATILGKYYKDHPKDISACNNYAWILAEQGKDIDQALKLAKYTLDHTQENPAAYDTLGWVYYKFGDREMAIHHLSRATRINPENATYFYHLAVVYRDAGQSKSADEAFSKAVKFASPPYPKWYPEAKAALEHTSANTSK